MPADKPEMRTIVLPVKCRLEDLGERYPGRSLVELGWRFDLELEACKSEGTFASEVNVCERPLFSGDEGDIVLAVWAPASHVAFFRPGARGTLKRAQYEIAQCILLEAPRDWIAGAP